MLEDAAQVGSQRLDIMEDELERYREYKQYADAGVQAAWDTLAAVVEDIHHPPRLDDGTLLRELRVATAQVMNLECDSAEIKTLLRRSDGVPKLRAAREQLQTEFDRMMGTAIGELREALGGFELRVIDNALRKYSGVGSRELRRSCADLRDHRAAVITQLEGVEDLRGRLLRLLDGDDYHALTAAIFEAEPYEVLRAEREAVRPNCCCCCGCCYFVLVGTRATLSFNCVWCCTCKLSRSPT